jgi:hypothetical protein
MLLRLLVFCGCSFLLLFPSLKRGVLAPFIPCSLMQVLTYLTPPRTSPGQDGKGGNRHSYSTSVIGKISGHNRC